MTDLILYRRRSMEEPWVKAPIECMLYVQETGWEYRYFLVSSDAPKFLV